MSSSKYRPVADLYDIYVNTTFDIPYWLKIAETASNEILELMCGTGRVTLPLLDAGHPVTCVDLSPDLLAVLRDKLAAKNLSADVHEADVCQLDLGKQFDLIILPFHAFAEILSDEDQLQALRVIRAHLAENGQFICTLHNPPVRLKSVDGQLRLAATYPYGDGKLLFWFHQQYDEPARRVDVMQFYEEYSAEGMMQAKRLLNMSFRIIYKAAFEEMIKTAGFRVVALHGNYDQSPFDEATSPFMIWTLAGV